MPLALALLDVLAPAPCAGCEGLLDRPGALLCRACAAEVPQRVRPFPVPSPLAWGWGLGAYDGPLGALVRQGKYRPDPRVFHALGRWLARSAHERLPQVDAVVPVPVPAIRRMSRGFDQGEILARAVALAVDRPVRAALRRVRGAEQAGRIGRARAAGARGAFRPAAPVPPYVLLVDDVCTTGATAAACADELLCGGARRVGLLCVAARAL
ncbi:ComF family protein [Myxococcota bacterium]|nr:ComF family protein [Myxococcota bacterium]